MNLAQTRHWHKVVARAAALVFIVMFFSIFDGCAAKFREPVNLYNVLPGTTININGPLEKVVDKDILTYQSTSDHISLVFDATQTGFWLGGAMWIGVVTMAPAIQPGDYEVKVFLAGAPSQKPASVFGLRVHKDYASLRQSYKSLIQRYFDVPFWWVSLACLPLLGAMIGVVYLLSQKVEDLLLAQGKAEVYRIMKGPAGQEIFFSLGTRHGIQPGDRVVLCDGEGKTIGTAEVIQASEIEAVASVGIDVPVTTGAIVVKQ